MISRGITRKKKGAKKRGEEIFYGQGIGKERLSSL